jgi:hypothetical protein
MKGNFRLIFADKFIKISILTSIFLILIQVILIVLYLSSLPPLIPLLNSQPWGFSRLYPSQSILLIPPVLVTVFSLNYLLSALFYRNNILISRILVFNSLLFIFLALLAFVQIIFLVF